MRIYTIAIQNHLETLPLVEEPIQPKNEEAASISPQLKATSKEESNVEEEKPTPAESEASKEQENVEEPSRECDTPRAETPHDESDYEDNIVVTVPKPQTHTNNYHDYRQNMNGRYNRSTNINEVETPSNQPQSHQVSKHL